MLCDTLGSTHRSVPGPMWYSSGAEAAAVAWTSIVLLPGPEEKGRPLGSGQGFQAGQTKQALGLRVLGA